MADHELSTAIDIAADPATVWRHLTAFEAYGDWNPFITSAEGRAEVGQRLRLRMEPPGGRAFTLRPRVLVVEPERALEWLGSLVIRGVFDGRHRFALSPTPTGTRLEHGEAFRGLMVPFLRATLDGPVRDGFDAMNAALADRAGHPAPG